MEAPKAAEQPVAPPAAPKKEPKAAPSGPAAQAAEPPPPPPPKPPKLTKEEKAAEKAVAKQARKEERRAERKNRPPEENAEPRRRRRKIDMTHSVWAPRQTWADSKDYYDTKEVELTRCANDWDRVMQLGVDRLICKKTDTEEEATKKCAAVAAVIAKNRQAVHLLFAYYCCRGTEVNFLYLNEWSAFVDEFGIADNKSKFCKKSDMDRLFIAVDTKAFLVREEMLKAEANESPLVKKAREAAAAKAAAAEAEGRGSPDSTGRDSPPGALKKQQTSSNVSVLFSHDDLKKKCLHRVEFIVALLNVAANRYVQTKQLASIAEAMSALIEDLKPRLDPKLYFRPDDFRKYHCYTPETDMTLKGLEASLRHIFTALDAKGRELLTLDEFKGFCRGADLLAPDCTERDATLAFSWSRMCVADETTERGHFKEICLPFEGFMEALCRIAVLKMMPTEEDFASSGQKDAGAFLSEMYNTNEEAYKDMLRERAPGWGAEPTQPMQDCITRLFEVITYAIDLKTGGTGASSKDLNFAAHNMIALKAKQWAKNHCWVLK